MAHKLLRHILSIDGYAADIVDYKSGDAADERVVRGHVNDGGAFAELLSAGLYPFGDVDPQGAHEVFLSGNDPLSLREGGDALSRNHPEVFILKLAEPALQRLPHIVLVVHQQNLIIPDLFPDLYVCAKSGTAEVGPDEIPNATFAGFIQSNEYPLAFIVIVENGGSGSAVAAPIAGDVLRACVEAMDE